MYVTSAEDFPPQWFPFFELVPWIAAILALLIIRNALLGYGVPPRRRTVECSIDLALIAFAVSVSDILPRIFPLQLVPVITLGIPFAVYFAKRGKYSFDGNGRVAAWALFDSGILVIAMILHSIIKFEFSCMC